MFVADKESVVADRSFNYGTLDEVREILAGGLVQAVLQPIFNMKTGAVLGYEALARGPEDSRLHRPVDLFAAAWNAGCFHALEELCRRRALEAKRHHLKRGEKLFVNVDPHVIPDLLDPICRTFTWVKELGIRPNEIVFELTEQANVNGYPVIRKALEYCRQQGYRFALDDVGMGHSGLASIVTLRPDYIKLDGFLIRGVATDGYRHSLIKGLAGYCHEVGIGLVAECIETAEDLKVLRKLGVSYGQGFFLATPGPGRPALRPEAAAVFARAGT